MTQKTFFCVSGIVFSLVFILHAVRLILMWEVVIGGWNVPHWVSVVALILSGALAYFAFKFKKTAYSAP